METADNGCSNSEMLVWDPQIVEGLSDEERKMVVLWTRSVDCVHKLYIWIAFYVLTIDEAQLFNILKYIFSNV